MGCCVVSILLSLGTAKDTTPQGHTSYSRLKGSQLRPIDTLKCSVGHEPDWREAQ
jgi:hypothetical protein